MSRTFSAVLIDDDEHSRINAFAEKWKEVFTGAHLPVDIRKSDSFDDDDLLRNRPHFVIVDNINEIRDGSGIVREEENRGIEYIASKKPNHPDSVFILTTRARLQIDVLGAKFPNPDLIAPKTQLSSKAYRDYLGGLLVRHLKRTPFGRLNVPNPDDESSIRDIGSALDSILEQCIHSIARPEGRLAIKQVNVSCLGGGYSGSLVCRVELFDEDNRGRVPLVLKISKGSNIYREVTAYNEYVRLNMPHDMRVDLLGWGEAGDYRGILYAFAFGSTPSLRALSQAVKEGEYEYVDNVISRVFMSSNLGWYDRPEAKENAEAFFQNSEEYSPSKDLRRTSSLKAIAATIGFDSIEVGLESLRFDEFRFPFIRKHLEKFGATSVPCCICHGDFNANNIFFGASPSSVAIIDFEYSGVDIIYKDFISLECSMRVDDSSDEIDGKVAFMARVEEEIALFGDAFTGSREYLLAIQRVRDAAKKCVERSGLSFDSRLFVLALSFHLFKLLGIERLPSHSHRQLLAAFVACGVLLER